METTNRVIKKLFYSFAELERSLSLAKRTLAARDPIPLELLRRIAEYEDIVSKQRKLARQLCNHLVTGEWDEVARHVRLINGLSTMIHEDVKALLAGSVEASSDEAAGALIS